MTLDVTVHVGSLQVDEKYGEPDLQFASREFDYTVAHQLKAFLDEEIIVSSGLVMMCVIVFFALPSAIY